MPTSRAPLDLQQSTWAVPVSSAHSTTPNISAPTPGNRRGCLHRSSHVVTAWLSQRGTNGAGNHTTLERLSRQPRSRAHHTQHMPPAMPATIPLGVPSQPQAVVWDPSASLRQVTDHGNDARRESQTRVFFVGTGRVRAHSECGCTVGRPAVADDRPIMLDRLMASAGAALAAHGAGAGQSAKNSARMR